MNVREEIIANLTRLCEAKKIKQKDIARELGVSTGSVNNWFKGQNGIDIENLYKLCQYLGVTLNQLVGIEPLSDAYSPDEVRLITIYRTLNAEGKSTATTVLESIAANPAMTQDTASARTALSS